MLDLDYDFQQELTYKFNIIKVLEHDQQAISYAI